MGNGFIDKGNGLRDALLVIRYGIRVEIFEQY